MDLKPIEEEFGSYAGRYDLADERIRLKLDHMRRVADLSRRIAATLAPPDEGDADHWQDLAYVLGLYHDIGRFEQARAYRTFSDARSVDHADLGVSAIREEGLLASLSPTDRTAVLTAIENHNKLAIDADVTDPRALTLCRIIRDADKVDIFRVFTESSLEATLDTTRDEIEGGVVTPAVVERLDARQPVPFGIRRTSLDKAAGILALAYDLNYPAAARAVLDLGYYREILAGHDFRSPGTAATVSRLRHEALQWLESFAGQGDSVAAS